MNITKKIISYEISTNLDINKDVSGALLDMFVDIVRIEALNKSVKINKFGTFTYIKTKARKGRNPKTLEKKISYNRFIPFIKSVTDGENSVEKTSSQEKSLSSDELAKKDAQLVTS